MPDRIPDRIVLVRHSVSRTDRDLSAHRWGLTEAGRRRCLPLARALERYEPGSVYTSSEPKARQTGGILARTLELPLEAVDDLGEQRRRTVGWYEDPAAFRAAVRRLFHRPDEVVFGEESAREAAARFAGAVAGATRGAGGRTPVIVAHGTVISLFANGLGRSAFRSRLEADGVPGDGGETGGYEPAAAFRMWAELGMPAYCVVGLPGLQVEERVDEVAERGDGSGDGLRGLDR